LVYSWESYRKNDVGKGSAFTHNNTTTTTTTTKLFIETQCIFLYCNAAIAGDEDISYNMSQLNQSTQ